MLPRRCLPVAVWLPDDSNWDCWRALSGPLPEELLDVTGGVAVTVEGGGLADWLAPAGATTVTAALIRSHVGLRTAGEREDFRARPRRRHRLSSRLVFGASPSIARLSAGGRARPDIRVPVQIDGIADLHSLRVHTHPCNGLNVSPVNTHSAPARRRWLSGNSTHSPRARQPGCSP